LYFKPPGYPGCNTLLYKIRISAFIQIITKKTFHFTLTAIVLLLAISAFEIFVPRQYPIPPIKKRAGIKFMNLTTGSRIAYTQLPGRGIKKPFPVIYLHGGPGGRITDQNIQIVSTLTDDGFDVFLYDQVGGGESSRLVDISGYTVERHINDLHAIIENLGVQKVILIGQSWGGILAVYFAIEFPAEIEKLILTNPGPLYPYPSELNAVKAPDSLHLGKPLITNAEGNKKVKNLRTSAMQFCAEHFSIRLAPDNEADEFNTWAGYMVNRSTVYDTSKAVNISEVKSIPSLAGYYSQVMTFKSLAEEQDPRPKLKDIDIPLLVLKSQYDNQIWGGTQEYLQLFKKHKLIIIPNAGHIIETEQAELYVKFIREFLNN
jgi:proline iminopeptidase